MNNRLQPLTLYSAAAFAGVVARADSPRRSLSPALAPQPDNPFSPREREGLPAAQASTHMPTAEQMTVIRYAAMAQAVRLPIGGQPKPI